MYVALLLLGLVVTAIGLVTVGFGIPINAFSIGNTLIVAGTTLVAAGLVLIGLAVVVRQLQRVASLLAARPAKLVETAEPVMTPTVKLTPPVAVSNSMKPAEAEMARSAEPRAPEPRIAEPQLSDAAPTSSAPPPPTKGPLDWLRPKSKVAANAEPPMVEMTDEAPLSPRQLARNGLTPEPGEPRVWSPSRDDAAPAVPSAPQPEPRAERTVRGAPASERPKDTGLFDVAWPDPKSAPVASETAKHEPPHETPVSRPRQQPVSERRAAAPAAPAILKSGVIDGMAYTLYADGSIEAELPQGTLNFASVDELRAHLEKHGG